MEIRETSLEAWRILRSTLPKLSDSRMRVYMALIDMGDNRTGFITPRKTSPSQPGYMSQSRYGSTGREVNAHLNSQSAHKRLSELCDRGLVIDGPVRICSISKMKSLTWVPQPAEAYRDPEPRVKRLTKVEEQALQIDSLKAKVLVLSQEIERLSSRTSQLTLLGLNGETRPGGQL